VSYGREDSRATRQRRGFRQAAAPAYDKASRPVGRAGIDALYIAEVPDEVTYSLYAAAVGAAVLRGGWAERTLAVLIAWQAVNGLIPPLRWTLGWPTDLVTFVVCVRSCCAAAATGRSGPRRARC